MKLFSLSPATLATTALTAALLAAPALAGDREYKLGAIEIEHPWARATVDSMPNGAAFLEIKNEAHQGDRLLSASAPVAAAVELHTHLHENGVMMMRKVDGIDLPADGKIKMAPGGLHIMLLGLKEPLKQGASFPLTLTFEKAGTTTVPVLIEGPGAGQHEHN
jgi:copper(I)-binding protein